MVRRRGRSGKVTRRGVTREAGRTEGRGIVRESKCKRGKGIEGVSEGG